MISNLTYKPLSNLLNTRSAFAFSRLAHVKGAPPSKLIDVSMAEWFNKVTEQYPQNVFIHSYSQNVSFTYEQCHKLALSLATGLIKNLRLKPKDRIGIYSYNKW